MIRNSILCTICARKGSKGLKNKNIINLLKKPLIHHTIDQANRINYITKVVVSSDSNKILSISKKKVDLIIKRPEKFSNDLASKIDAIKHALIVSEKKFNIIFDTIIDLDVTSPLRSLNDIKRGLKFFFKKKSGNLVSGYESRKNPYFNQIIKRGNLINLACKSKNKIVRRQDAPKVFDLNASIYIWKRKDLLKSKRLINKRTVFYQMPYIRSIDIDDKFDFKIVEYILKHNLNK